MLDDILEKLDSDDPTTRQAGWQDLRREVVTGSLEIADEEKQILVSRLHDEPVDMVRWRANEGLFSVCLSQSTAPAVAVPISVAESAPSHVSHWFWEPLRRRSAVFYGFEPARRRDEDAVIELARALPKREFPEAAFVRIPLSEPGLDARLDFEPETVCLVGRLGIFGEKAVSEFQSSKTRFFFPCHERPPHLAPGALDEQFHRIHQRNECQQDLPPYIARQDEGSRLRTDYALVQRYFDEAHNRFVIILAGCSVLGTLGAVEWATNPKVLKIPNPTKGFKATDVFEALIEVEGEYTAFPWHFKSRSPKAIRVLAGDGLEWYPNDGRWSNRRPDLLRIRRDERGIAQEVFGDSSRRERLFHAGGTLVKFVDAIFRLTEGKSGSILYPRQWEGHKKSWQAVASNPTYRRRLKDAVHDAITIDEDHKDVKLNVPIVDAK